MMRNVLIKTTVYQYSLHVSTIENYLQLNVQTRGQSAQDVALWDPQLTVSPKQMLWNTVWRKATLTAFYYTSKFRKGVV